MSLRGELMELRRGVGVTPAKFANASAINSALGVDHRQDAYVRLTELVVSQGDNKYWRALRNALGLGDSSLDTLSARREDLAQREEKHSDTIERWENVAMEELAQLLDGRPRGAMTMLDGRDEDHTSISPAFCQFLRPSVSLDVKIEFFVPKHDRRGPLARDVPAEDLPNMGVTSSLRVHRLMHIFRTGHTRRTPTWRVLISDEETSTPIFDVDFRMASLPRLMFLNWGPGLYPPFLKYQIDDQPSLALVDFDFMAAIDTSGAELRLPEDYSSAVFEWWWGARWGDAASDG